MYELRCLGEATLRSPTGQLIHFRSRKHFALLIYLALNADRAHRRERLAGLLWSDSEESKARHSLSQALYAVRRLLDGAVRIEGEDLELRPDGLWIDAVELERLLAADDPTAAADLYRGEFLEGFWIRGAQGFEEWAGHQRARLAAVARDALRQTVASARDRCDWLEVRQRAERLAQLDPFDETAHAELMRALWMTGDRTAALDHYEKLERLLVAELQTRPSRETEALAERIRQRPVSGGWSTQRLLREAEQPIFAEPPFVGRKRELAALAEEWQRVLTGETRTVALVGGAGIGKTRLADEFLKSLALDDLASLRCRCYEAEQSLPYGPVAEALRQGISDIDLSDVNPLWLAELARIVPEAHERYRELPEPAPLDAEGGRRRLFEGIAQVLRSACELRPVLLFVDDLHWADDSSLSLLHYLHRRVSNGLYLLTAHRPEELAARTSTATADLLSVRNSRVRSIHLEGLDRTESSDLLAAVLGEEADAEAIDRLGKMSAGNPFFAIELARNLAETKQTEARERPAVPDTIRALLDRRFAALSDQAVALMQQTAFLGSRVNYAVLCAATGLPPVEFDGVLRELTRAGILVQEDAVLSFRHDLIREVAAAQVPAALCSALHLRAARALIRTKGSPGEIAVHLSAAGDTRRAFDYALRGTEAAEQVYALEKAADLLELAIQHAPDQSTRMDLIGRLGKLYLHMREYAKARPRLHEHLLHITRSNRPRLEELEARRDLLVVDMYSSALSLEESATALKSLYSELETRGLCAPRLEADILRGLFWAAARSFKTALVEDTIKSIGRLHARALQPEVRCRTARSLGIYESYKGRLDRAEALLEQACTWAKQAEDDSALVDSYIGLSTLLQRVLRVELAERILKVALPLAEHRADPAQVTALLCNCGACYMYLHDADRAELLLERARQTLESSGYYPDTLPSVLYDLGFVAFIRGRYEIAEGYWTRTLEANLKHGVLPVTLECLASLGGLALKRNQVAAARSLAAQALRLARRGQFLLDQRFGLHELLARLRYEAGRPDLALSDLSRTATFAQKRDIPLYLVAQRTQLELLLREGRCQEAAKVKEQLWAVAQSRKASWWMAEVSRIWNEHGQDA